MNLKRYKFKELVYDLSTGREIEFDFKNAEYSITNYRDRNGKSCWQFHNSNKTQNLLICEFNEGYILRDFLKNLVIEDIELQNIFNNHMYSNLYIL